ncbi:MAG: NAD-dependent epimerase/dehydratase family protein [Cyclobacteriaceae bacterium]|nr:NAD-dependent epimerase/dehydratase family protein [Cyclobacteriaceae bacterium]MCH8515087.1 NAD-dependent epimerase/dehydratase family protein [Cyclobacteriaceae bacterium]
MRILITGATGLIGSQLVRKLLSRGYRVRAIHRKNNDYGLLKDVAEKIEWIHTDLASLIFHAEAFNEVDAVFHCAAKVSYSKRDHEEMRTTNIEGTKDLVNACLKYRIKDFFYVSSVAAIGRSGKENNFSESSQWENSEYNSAYSKSKYLAELEVWRGVQEGLSVLIVNPSIVIAPGNKDNSSMKMINYVLQEKPFYTKGLVNYVDVWDLTDLSLILFEKGVRNQRFIINAGTVTYKEMFSEIAKVFDKKSPSIHVSKPWLKIGILIENLLSKLTFRKASTSLELGRNATTSHRFSNKKVIDETSFRFRPLSDSIQLLKEEMDGLGVSV